MDDLSCDDPGVDVGRRLDGGPDRDLAVAERIGAIAELTFRTLNPEGAPVVYRVETRPASMGRFQILWVRWIEEDLAYSVPLSLDPTMVLAVPPMHWVKQIAHIIARKGWTFDVVQASEATTGVRPEDPPHARASRADGTRLESEPSR